MRCAWQIGKGLDEYIAYRISYAFAYHIQNSNNQNTRLTNDDPLNNAIIIGADIRPSSKVLKQAAINGIMDAGSDVIDLGMSGTEEMYFATSFYKALGGIEVTASHNPIDYNGFKFVREHSYPISMESGLQEIQQIAECGQFTISSKKGNHTLQEDKTAYINHLLSYINKDKLKPLTIVVNCGNGSAAPVVDLLEQQLQDTPLKFIKINHEPDGSFPNGIPNPMLAKNRTVTSQAVIEHRADLAIAFDGDFDRCFFFDEKGRFIDGTYVVGLLATAFLQKNNNDVIIYDSKNIFNTQNIIAQKNAKGIISQPGHSFIKSKMRQYNAVYGGESSAHHYFRDFNYCDSGMIPWLLVIELLSQKNCHLSALVDKMIEDFPISGEFNFRLTTTTAKLLQQTMDNLHQFDTNTPIITQNDDLSVDFGAWRFHLRASGTEPLVRLNMEGRGNKALLDDKIQLICDFIQDNGGILADS